MSTRNSSKPKRDKSKMPVAVSVEPLDPERDVIIDTQRQEAIELAAYYLAAERGFEPGHELEDWFEAEMQFDATRAS